MPHVPVEALLLHLGTERTSQLSDRELLEQFLRDASSPAFAELVRRHGPLVRHVCRSVLHHWHDAEDAFQATFLVLARKAHSLRRQEAVAAWLHGVAYRLSQ